MVLSKVNFEKSRRFITSTLKMAAKIDCRTKDLAVSPPSLSELVYINCGTQKRVEEINSTAIGVKDKIKESRKFLGFKEKLRNHDATITMRGGLYTRSCVAPNYLPQLLSIIASNVPDSPSAPVLTAASLLINWVHPFESDNGKTCRLFTQCYPIGISFRDEIIQFYRLRIEVWLTAVPRALYDDDYTALKKVLEKIYA